LNNLPSIQISSQDHPSQSQARAIVPNLKRIALVNNCPELLLTQPNSRHDLGGASDATNTETMPLHCLDFGLNPRLVNFYRFPGCVFLMLQILQVTSQKKLKQELQVYSIHH
jgi:hypothetical protein